jgi:hypothetical protein
MAKFKIENCKNTMNAIYRLIARWLPRRLLYFCIIQAWAYVTSEKYRDKMPDEVTWDMTCDYLWETSK